MRCIQITWRVTWYVCDIDMVKIILYLGARYFWSTSGETLGSWVTFTMCLGWFSVYTSQGNSGVIACNAWKESCNLKTADHSMHRAKWPQMCWVCTKWSQWLLLYVFLIHHSCLTLPASDPFRVKLGSTLVHAYIKQTPQLHVLSSIAQTKP